MTESFEAKKHAYRQTQDGIVVSFTIHPNDMPEHLALAPLGTRFGVAVAEIGDDEKPIDPVMGTEDGRHAAAHQDRGCPVAPTTTKDRRPFASLPLSQQAALRCQDNDFKLYIGASNAEDAAVKVRDLCGIASRSELDDGGNQAARGDWRALEARYQAWLTTQRYAEARR